VLDVFYLTNVPHKKANTKFSPILTLHTHTHILRLCCFHRCRASTSAALHTCILTHTYSHIFTHTAHIYTHTVHIYNHTAHIYTHTVHANIYSHIPIYTHTTSGCISRSYFHLCRASTSSNQIHIYSHHIHIHAQAASPGSTFIGAEQAQVFLPDGSQQSMWTSVGSARAGFWWNVGFFVQPPPNGGPMTFTPLNYYSLTTDPISYR
jgi:hypothetical protein